MTPEQLEEAFQLVMTRKQARAYADGTFEMTDFPGFDEIMDEAQATADEEGKDSFIIIRIKGETL